MIARDKALISHAEIINLNLNQSGIDYHVYGFGNVFTFPPYRGNGYGKQVVFAGIGYIVESKADVGILFCDPSLQPFYEKAGWIGLPSASTRIGTPEKSEENDGLRMMRFLSEKGKNGYSAFVNQPMYVNDPW